MSESSAFLAGPGLLRSGNTLSVNPSQRLKTLSVRDKITAPEPVDNSDAATKSYVDVKVEQSLPTAGSGLEITLTNSYAVKKNIDLDTITLTGPIVRNDQVITKAYVDNAVRPFATTRNVETIAADVLKKADLETAIEPFATRSYVLSLSDEKVTKTYVDNVAENLADKKYVQEKVANLVDYAFVEKAVSGGLRKEELEARLSGLADYSYVDVKSKNITDFVNNAVGNLASKADLDTVTENFTVDVGEGLEKDGKKLKLSSDQPSIVSLGNLNSLQVNGVTKFSTSYLVPSDNDILQIPQKTFILINPDTKLGKLTVKLPENAEDGQYLVVTASRDIDRFSIQGFAKIGDIQIPEYITMTAGTALKFVYSQDVSSWFVI